VVEEIREIDVRVDAVLETNADDIALQRLGVN
jgi:hypothetical protein